MTLMPFVLPAGRILPPTTAYAAGIVCELRPDLADGVRSAVLGDAAMTALDVLTLARVEAGDEQGANALSYLREIVHYGGNAPTALHGLADVLGLIPRRRKEMILLTPDGEERLGDPTIGDVWGLGFQVPMVCGLGYARFPGRIAANGGQEVLLDYLRDGFDAVWGMSVFTGQREACRRLIPIHAHTVSLDPDTRAAWAKAHLDALGAA